MDILISGGSGFLGSAFSEAIIKRYQKDDNMEQVTWLRRDSKKEHSTDIKMMKYDELE